MEEIKNSPFTVESQHLDTVQHAVRREHQQSFWTGLKTHRKAVFWSLVLSTTIFMEGYDTMLMGNLFAQPAFRKRYGTLIKKGSYQISSAWQSGLNTGGTCGQLVGLLVSGYASDTIGFRKTMLSGLFLILALNFILVFAPSLAVLEVGQVLMGIPLGLFQTTAVVYAMEVSPVVLQGYFTVYVNICWGIGHLIGSGILRGSLQLHDDWSYRMPFTIQWFWCLLLIPLISFAPESPWWHVRHGRLAEATSTHKYLVSDSESSMEIEQTIALMAFTTEHERRLNAQTSYLGCFRRSDCRRTLVAIGIYCVQVFSGNSLRSSSTYFLEQAGMPTTQAFNLTIVNYAIAVLGGFASWATLHYIGRRKIYLYSLAIMFVIMMVIGGLGVAEVRSNNTTYSWAIGAVLIVSSFLYNAATGPLTNTLCVEIPSSILRSKTIALARWWYSAVSIAAGILQPYMTNPTAWNWGARSGFFWAGTCAISLIFAFFFVPETKDRTTTEMDILYEKRIPAWRSARAEISVENAMD